ncbi:hypothetical protein [Haladaptatus cibarius]|uniref:hypothetical protein n=1 Tax=Haladaptatus cibarius TaxID=453847 RepID=UPI000678500A|nr:hypothetical protein [Haladaptatus cibarius]
MHPRVKASLLWGVVGLLSFLVLLQGYELFTDYRYSIGLKVGMALLVAVGASASTYVADGLLD